MSIERGWLRVAIIILTVGGGFTGVALICQMLFNRETWSNGATLSVCGLVLVLYLFVLISGLLYISNPKQTIPLIVAFALQIPSISSPLLTYQFAAGFHFTLGATLAGGFFLSQIGSSCQLFVGRSFPWGFGVNLVALALVVCLVTFRVLLKDEREDKEEA